MPKTPDNAPHLRIWLHRSQWFRLTLQGVCFLHGMCRRSSLAQRITFLKEPGNQLEKSQIKPNQTKSNTDSSDEPPKNEKSSSVIQQCTVSECHITIQHKFTKDHFEFVVFPAHANSYNPSSENIICLIVLPTRFHSWKQNNRRSPRSRTKASVCRGDRMLASSSLATFSDCKLLRTLLWKKYVPKVF